MLRFNLSILECKCHRVKKFFEIALGFNLSILECKCKGNAYLVSGSEF